MSVCGWRSLSARVWGAPGVFGGWVRGCGRVWLRVAGRERGLVCAGRVDKWEEGEREPVSVGSLSLSFSSFVGRMAGLEPAASAWVALILLGFVRSVLPRCSLAFVCFACVGVWGGWWVSNLLLPPWGALILLGFVRMSGRAVLLVAFACLGARVGACIYSSRLQV